MQSFTDYFRETYYQKLITPTNGNPVRNRADSLLKVFELLQSRQRTEGIKTTQGVINIVETGCMRVDHGDFNYGGDGCSTVIFDHFAQWSLNQNFSKVRVNSVDISKENYEYTKTKVSPHTNVYNRDSVEFLWSFPELETIDLLYLDSFDVEKGNFHPSAFHHICELTAAMKNLKKDSLVVVDDADAFFDGGLSGKAVYVDAFMRKIGATPIYMGYQSVWQLK